MSQEILDTRVFTNGAARYSDLVYILSKDKTMMENEVPHTSVIGVDMGNWGDCVNVNWNSTAIAVARLPEEKVIIIGEDGEICTYVGGESNDENPLLKVSMIRNANSINGFVYACGMKRQVFKRIDEDKWVNISAPEPTKKEKVGFESIDGYSESEIYAVGWNGEIWEYDGKQWFNRSGLTNLILTSVCCAPDGNVYAVGQQGIIIKGRHDAWDVIELEEDFNKDFWGTCFFNDKLYISTISNLFTLNINQLDLVDFGDADVASCYGLTQAEGVMWSVGANDVLSYDGSSWIKYT